LVGVAEVDVHMQIEESCGGGQSLFSVKSSQSNRKRRRRPFESGGQNFEALGPTSLPGPASTLVLQRNRERKPPTHTEAILALLAHDTGRDRQGPL
jgi:hypothetical protein